MLPNTTNKGNHQCYQPPILITANTSNHHIKSEQPLFSRNWCWWIFHSEYHIHCNLDSRVLWGTVSPMQMILCTQCCSTKHVFGSCELWRQIYIFVTNLLNMSMSLSSKIQAYYHFTVYMWGPLLVKCVRYTHMPVEVEFYVFCRYTDYTGGTWRADAGCWNAVDVW